MRAKDYLKQIRELDLKAEEALRLVESCESDITRITPRYGGTPVMSSGTGDLSGPVAQLIGAQQRADAAIDRYVDLKERIVDMLLELPKADERKCLRLRYVDYRNNDGWRLTTWDAIAEEMHCSRRAVTDLHGAALVSFARLMEDHNGC